MNLSRRDLKFTRDDRLPARFGRKVPWGPRPCTGEPKEPSREDRLAPIPNLEGTISDKGLFMSTRAWPEDRAGHLPPTWVRGF